MLTGMVTPHPAASLLDTSDLPAPRGGEFVFADSRHLLHPACGSMLGMVTGPAAARARRGLTEVIHAAAWLCDTSHALTPAPLTRVTASSC